MNFDQCFQALIKNEGGLSLDPRDRGNWTSGKVGVGELKGTKYGISAMSYPELDIGELTLQDAKTIYKRDYWDAVGCDLLPDLIAFDVFDMAVNSGQGAAIRALQKILFVPVDGIMGEKTRSTLRGQDPGYLWRAFNGARLLHMTSLPEAIWESQGRGLVNRVAKRLMMI